MLQLLPTKKFSGFNVFFTELDHLGQEMEDSGSPLLWARMVVNLTQARIFWEEETSIGKVPLADWQVEHFLN